MVDLWGFAQVDIEETQFLRELGKDVIFDATMRYAEQAAIGMQQTNQLLVEGVTTNFKEKYTLPMGGTLPKVAHGAELTPVDVVGNWDVAYPVDKIGGMVVSTKEQFAYMTPALYSKRVEGILGKYRQTMRIDMMKAIFNKTTRTVIDDQYGSLTVQPLANSAVDSVLYPPEVGTPNGAARSVNAYVGTNYAAADISDTNNPFEQILDYYEATYGYMTYGSPVVAFINKAQRAKVEALSDFRPIVITNQTRANDTEYAAGETDPMRGFGKTLGYVGSIMVVAWEYIPTGYIYSQYMGGMATAPLQMRVHPAGTGLGGNGLLQPEAEAINSLLDLRSWVAYYGFGVGNRLNGFCQQLVASTTYTTPAIYAY